MVWAASCKMGVYIHLGARLAGRVATPPSRKRQGKGPEAGADNAFSPKKACHLPFWVSGTNHGWNNLTTGPRPYPSSFN